MTTDDLNLRTSPSLSATVLRVIPAGATVTLTGQNQNGFASVSYQGTNGWASTDYLDQSGSGAPTPTPSPTPNPSAGTGTATATDNLNLRAGPSTGDTVLRVIPAGGVVTLTGQNQNGYLSVSYQGTSGWAYGAYLDQSGGSTPSPTPTPTTTPTQPPDSGTSTGSGTATATSNLNLRSGPSTGDDVLRVIPAGAAVTLTGRSQNGYLSVSYDGTAGWAYADYLDQSQSGNTAPTPTPSPSPTPSPDSGTTPPKGMVTSSLNLRSGPGIAYNVIDVMPEGATVTITGDPQNGYYPVTYQGEDGWASGDYLQISSGTTPSSGTATTTSNVNLRAGPSTGDSVLMVIPAGAIVTLTGQSQNGYKSVTYQGTSGWVYADYLQ